MTRVIKADRQGPALIPGEVADARDEARAILEHAHAQAERVRLEAFAQGHARGLSEGRAHAAKQLLDIADARAMTLREAEHDTLKAALQVASHLLCATLETAPEHIVAMVTPLVSRVRRARTLSVRAHVDDAETLRAHIHAITAQTDLAGTLQIIADPEFARGDLLVESNIGAIDSRIATRLEDLQKAWLNKS